MSSVVQISPTVSSKQRLERKRDTRSRRFNRAIKRQAGTAIAIGTVATSLVALSLTHLADGVQTVTHSTTWEAWAMASAIDLGFVTIELAQVMASSDKVRKTISKWSRWAIPGTLIGSAVMNAFAFAASAETYIMMGAAISLGVAVPALIYAMTRIGAALYLDCQIRTA